MAQDKEIESTGTMINEVQLLLPEKRTSLAATHTGIAVFALPLLVLSILTATSKYHNVTQVTYLLVPPLMICVALVLLGTTSLSGRSSRFGTMIGLSWSSSEDMVELLSLSSELQLFLIAKARESGASGI